MSVKLVIGPVGASDASLASLGAALSALASGAGDPSGSIAAAESGIGAAASTRPGFPCWCALPIPTPGSPALHAAVTTLVTASASMPRIAPWNGDVLLMERG